jgi:hypothetical protein
VVIGWIPATASGLDKARQLLPVKAIKLEDVAELAPFGLHNPVFLVNINVSLPRQNIMERLQSRYEKEITKQV